MKQGVNVTEADKQIMVGLLLEVFNGQYHNFREYLTQNEIANLDLSGKVQDKNLSKLGEALQGTAVTTITLHSNQITAPNAIRFMESLQGKTALTTIDMSTNWIGGPYFDLSIIIFAQKFKENPSVVNLNLSWNGFYSSIQCFGEGLKGNTSLATLSLAGCHIDDASAKVLINALNETNVTSLYFRWNKVNANDQFIESLKNVSNLKMIDLIGNQVDFFAACKIGRAVKGTSLLVCNLANIPDTLEQALAHNKDLMNEALTFEITPNLLLLKNQNQIKQGAPFESKVVTKENNAKFKI